MSGVKEAVAAMIALDDKIVGGRNIRVAFGQSNRRNKIGDRHGRRSGGRQRREETGTERGRETEDRDREREREKREEPRGGWVEDRVGTLRHEQSLIRSVKRRGRSRRCRHIRMVSEPQSTKKQRSRFQKSRLRFPTTRRVMKSSR